MRLHRDHRRIRVGHATRTAAGQRSCRPRSNLLALIGAFMAPAYALCRLQPGTAARYGSHDCLVI
jgi:hypothetical protein